MCLTVRWTSCVQTGLTSSQHYKSMTWSAKYWSIIQPIKLEYIKVGLLAAWALDTIQDFWKKLSMKKCIHIYSVDRQWRLESIHTLLLSRSIPLDLSRSIPFWVDPHPFEMKGVDRLKTSLMVHTVYSCCFIALPMAPERVSFGSQKPFFHVKYLFLYGS